MPPGPDMREQPMNEFQMRQAVQQAIAAATIETDVITVGGVSQLGTYAVDPSGHATQIPVPVLNANGSWAMRLAFYTKADLTAMQAVITALLAKFPA